MALHSLGTGSDKIASGTTAQRPTLTAAYAGSIRYNTTLKQFEQWEGTQWKPLSSSVAVGTTPPSPSNPGDLWYNPDDGRLYVYYTDSNSSQWVDASPSQSDFDSTYVNLTGDTMTGDLTIPSLNGGPLAGFRNQFINGACEINQRGVTVITASPKAEYFCDRWVLARNSGTVDATLVNNITDLPGFSQAIRKDSVETTVQQAVELNQKGLNSQFPVGSVWTISFYATTSSPNRSVGDNAGTFRKRSTNSTDDVAVGSITSVSIVQVGSSRWYRHAYTFTVTGDVQTSPQAGSIICLNIALLRETIPANTLMTGAQLEPGPVATPFEHRPMQTELALCHRYYQEWVYPARDIAITMSKNDATLVRSDIMELAVPLRVRPTTTFANWEKFRVIRNTNALTWKNGSFGIVAGSAATTNVDNFSFFMDIETNSMSWDNWGQNWVKANHNSVDLAPKIYLDAEL